MLRDCQSMYVTHRNQPAMVCWIMYFPATCDGQSHRCRCIPRCPRCHLVAACTSPDTNNRHPGQTPPAWEAPWRATADGWRPFDGLNMLEDVGRCWMVSWMCWLRNKKKWSLRYWSKSLKFLQKPLLSNKISKNTWFSDLGGWSVIYSESSDVIAKTLAQ